MAVHSDAETRPEPPRTRSGPIVIAYDGSPASEYALREAGTLLAGSAALVLTVWKAGVGFELISGPATMIGLPPAELDIRTALDIDRTMYENAQRAAEQGAQLAREVGFGEADSLVVAEDPDIPVSDTILTIARERDAQAIVVGAHGHGKVSEVILGSISRDVIRHADRPVVVSTWKEKPAED
ncbi:MAG: hypothetical protein QOG15_3683 [Solirubrobacteraceae bacterium]|jgi:nucleotide-binding universal stress UspA family protein|nr:hypothetical protein [Solirubrobacteraceae bacterium]